MGDGGIPIYMIVALAVVVIAVVVPMVVSWYRAREAAFADHARKAGFEYIAKMGGPPPDLSGAFPLFQRGDRRRTTRHFMRGRHGSTEVCLFDFIWRQHKAGGAANRGGNTEQRSQTVAAFGLPALSYVPTTQTGVGYTIVLGPIDFFMILLLRTCLACRTPTLRPCGDSGSRWPGGRFP